MTNKPLTLTDFGWSNHFQAQLSLEEVETTSPVRVMTVHRNALEVAAPDLSLRIPPVRATELEGTATTGDWLLFDPTTQTAVRVLERKSLLKRRTAGINAREQLIAANIDTLFIVSSCNDDFNAARIERYLALAQEAGAEPIIILTKSDSSADAETYADEARDLMPGLLVKTLDARSAKDVERLRPWCISGQTVALLGSSGVGKSTLINTLLGADVQATGDIRADDSKGRHTTTGRSLHYLPTGGWLMDTPGMREVQLTDVATGIEEVFTDIAELMLTCRFSNCQHETEPGCAILEGIKQGTLDEERLKRYQKLLAEEKHNSETIAERHTRNKTFGKKVKSTMREKKRRQDK